MVTRGEKGVLDEKQSLRSIVKNSQNLGPTSPPHLAYFMSLCNQNCYILKKNKKNPPSVAATAAKWSIYALLDLAFLTLSLYSSLCFCKCPISTWFFFTILLAFWYFVFHLSNSLWRCRLFYLRVSFSLLRTLSETVIFVIASSSSLRNCLEVSSFPCFS